jgi:hypothetical protein
MWGVRSPQASHKYTQNGYKLDFFIIQKTRFKASPVLNIIPFPSPLRRGLGRGAGKSLPEGFHIWLNYEPFAV